MAQISILKNAPSEHLCSLFNIQVDWMKKFVVNDFLIISHPAINQRDELFAIFSTRGTSGLVYEQLCIWFVGEHCSFKVISVLKYR